MVGFRAARPVRRGTVETGLTLDLARAMKLLRFRPGLHSHGTIAWTNSHTGDVTATVGYEAQMSDPQEAWVRLFYSVDGCDGVTRKDCRIELTTTVPHFGGLRWWFICPVLGRRVRCLHLGPQGDVFASRHALNLGYQSQRETWGARRLRAAHAVSAKLGTVGGLDEHPPKPKWMRWPTYERLVDKRERASLGSLIVMFAALNRSSSQAFVEAAVRADPDLLTGSGLI